MSRIQIYDTTLRDGSQGEGVNFSLQDKLLITRKLDELGFDFVEGGYPLSNPKDEEYIYGQRNGFDQVLGSQLHMPVDIFHHHNCIVDQNPYREYKCKQRNTVKRKAIGPRGKQRAVDKKRDGYGNPREQVGTCGHGWAGRWSAERSEARSVRTIHESPWLQIGNRSGESDS